MVDSMEYFRSVDGRVLVCLLLVFQEDQSISHTLKSVYCFIFHFVGSAQGLPRRQEHITQFICVMYCLQLYVSALLMLCLHNIVTLNQGCIFFGTTLPFNSKDLTTIVIIDPLANCSHQAKPV